MGLVHHEVHEAEAHALVQELLRPPPLAAGQAEEGAAEQQDQVLRQVQHVEEGDQRDDDLGQADLHAGLGDPVAHHDVGEGQGDDPDEEGEHQEDVVEAGHEVAEDDDPRGAQDHGEDPEEVEDLRRQRGRQVQPGHALHQEARGELRKRLRGPGADLVGEAALVERAHGTQAAAVHDLGQIHVLRARRACDEAVELTEVLADQSPAGQRREDDGRDEPGDDGDDGEHHGEHALAGVLHRQDAVDQVDGRHAEGGGVVRLPVGDVDVLPGLVLVRQGPAGEEVPRDARDGPLAHGRRHVLVLEDEEEGRREDARDRVVDRRHRALLEDHLAELREEAHKPHGDDPLRAEGGAERRELPGPVAGELEEDKEAEVDVDGHVHEEVAHVEGHRGEVEGERVQDADPLAQQVVVPRADHGDAAACYLREEVRGRVEGSLPPLLELERVDVDRRLGAHVHVVAGEDVLAEVHHRGRLAHAASVPRPEAVHEVGMPVVHAHPHAAEEALVDGPEGPLGGGVALPDGALPACEDVLAEAQIAAERRHAVLLVQRHEGAEDVGDLEALADVGAHVAVERLDAVPFREAKGVELVPRLALRLVLALAQPQRELPWQHLEDAQAAPGLVPGALHAAVVERAGLGAAPLAHEAADHAPDLGEAALVEVEHEQEVVLGVPLQEHLDGLVVLACPVLLAKGLVREDDLDVVLRDVLLGELPVVLLDLRQGREGAAVLERADDRFRDGLRAEGGPEADLDGNLLVDLALQEAMVEVLGLRVLHHPLGVQALRQEDPLVREL
mmetsp:Transcript_6067/g.12868  ORF Transcript_6067/g.12868 Transcript_6067/m.12868 type:complete len:787 (-) Transcript_6067:3102-5462(-)